MIKRYKLSVLKSLRFCPIFCGVFLVKSFFTNYRQSTMTKCIFVSGGGVSSLGKGMTDAAVAAVREARGVKVTRTKMDAYINADPGTRTPFQHGEVFVPEDGAETELDLGYYERCLRDSMMSKSNNFTSGRIYQNV